MAHKPPRSPEERLIRWSRSMTPGAVAGQVAAAQPVPIALGAKLRVSPGAPNPAGKKALQQDDLSSQVTGAPPPIVYTLTFQPISQSEHLHQRAQADTRHRLHGVRHDTDPVGRAAEVDSDACRLARRRL